MVYQMKTCKDCRYLTKTIDGKGKDRVERILCECNPPEVMGVYLGRTENNKPIWETLQLSPPTTTENHIACKDIAPA